MRRFIMVLVMLSVFPARTTAAQAAGLVPGARVQAILDAPTLFAWGTVREVEGTVVAIDPDTLVLNAAHQADPVRIPLVWISEVKQWNGSRWVSRAELNEFTDEFTIGRRVRVTAPSVRLQRHAGTLTRFTGDTLVVGGRRVPVALVTRFEIFRGRRSQAGRGALIGAAVGAVVGAGFGLVSGDDRPSRGCLVCFDFTAEEKAVIGGVFLGGAGALVGLVSGALIRTDRWEEATLDRFRVSVSPQRDGHFALGASVRF